MSARMSTIGEIKESLRQDIEGLQVDKNTTTTVSMLSWFREERGGQGLVLEITLKVIGKKGEYTLEKDKMSLIVVE